MINNSVIIDESVNLKETLNEKYFKKLINVGTSRYKQRVEYD